MLGSVNKGVGLFNKLARRRCNAHEPNHSLRDRLMANENNISVEYFKSIINYDEHTGDFTWVQTYRNRIAGKKAGNINKKNNYWYLNINRKHYLAHRVAWFLMTGEWPEDDIDHINRNRIDNRFCNLRKAVRSQNNINSGKHKNNTSGFRGVRDRTHLNKGYQARIGVFGKYINLGTFSTLEEAYAAYIKAAGTHYGEYARGA